MSEAQCCTKFISNAYRWPLLQIQKLSLPFFVTIPMINMVLALAALAMIWVSKGKDFNKRMPTALFLLLYVIHISIAIMAVLSAIFVLPLDFITFRAEQQWQEWFRSKDEVTIRSIQNQLLCCGFNSMRDRAWPFPSQDVSAATCQRTSGFSTHCASLWQEKLRMVAMSSVTASILMEALLVCASMSEFWTLLI